MPLCRLPPALKTQHIPALGRRTFPEPKPCPCLAQMRALRLGKVPGEPHSATPVLVCLQCWSIMLLLSYTYGGGEGYFIRKVQSPANPELASLSSDIQSL